MTATSLASQQRLQYRLPESDRQQILSTLPPKIEYPGGIVPDFVLRQYSHIFPKMAGRTNLSIVDAESIMRDEASLQLAVFSENNGEIFG